jgi:hypothetical protein
MPTRNTTAVEQAWRRKVRRKKKYQTFASNKISDKSDENSSEEE